MKKHTLLVWVWNESTDWARIALAGYETTECETTVGTKRLVIVLIGCRGYFVYGLRHSNKSTL